MGGIVEHFLVTLRLHFRNRLALLYGYLFPLIFLVVFWALYRHERVPLLLHFGELLTVSILGSACFGLPTTLVSERERGLWQHYQLTPAPRVNLLLSTLAARGVIVVTAAALQFAVASAVGMTAPAHPLALALAFGAATFAFISLGLVIAAMADTVPAVQALGQCLFLPMLILGGVAVPLASLPDWAQRLSAYLPGRYAVDSLQGATTGDGLPSTGRALLVLMLIAASALLVGVRLFRWRAGLRFRQLPGKRWLLVPLAMWILIGAFTPNRVSTTGKTAASPMSPPVAPAKPKQPWELLTALEMAAIDYRVPSDSGLVTPIAPPEETPDDATDLSLAKLEGELPHWPPGQAEDSLQRVFNLLSVAAVVDVMQNPVERFVPALIQQRLERDFPHDTLVPLLAWISLHPDTGTVINNLAELNLGGPVAPEVVRERVQIYATKFLARITGHAVRSK